MCHGGGVPSIHMVDSSVLTDLTPGERPDSRAVTAGETARHELLTVRTSRAVKRGVGQTVGNCLNCLVTFLLVDEEALGLAPW